MSYSCHWEQTLFFEWLVRGAILLRNAKEKPNDPENFQNCNCIPVTCQFGHVSAVCDFSGFVERRFGCSGAGFGGLSVGFRKEGGTECRGETWSHNYDKRWLVEGSQTQNMNMLTD